MSYATNSSGNYSGTIVVSPIRPANPSSNIATIFSNEIKGAHHTYETLSERDSIIEERRDWGMLCTVYNDSTSSNNKTYILKQFINTNIQDNNNWVEFVSNGDNFVPTGGQWLNSVNVVSATPSVFIDGYRYLVDNGGIGDFAGQDGKIAQYNLVALTYSFIEPRDGTSLRVESEQNVVYKYQGTFSTGKWVKEYLNQIRYLTAISSDGMTYSASSSQTPLTSYSDSVYYVTFNMTSSGTVSLQIDSLGFIDIKKLQNNTLNFLQPNDIIPNVQYQLLYNSGILQTVLPSSSTTTIGTPEDGSYTDGLFTDFNSTTPIGTAVDRFNEVLKYLAPPIAPFLTSWSATGSFRNGGISFDSTVGGFVSATGSPYGSVGKGETFSSSDNYYRLGIMSKVSQPVTGDLYYQDISGVFNINVPYLYAYATHSFGYADIGTLSFYLNGVTISSVDLTNLSSIDTTISGATSGVNLSAATSSRFSTGDIFPLFQNRTGTYLIKRDNPNILDGYNYFIARHDSVNGNYILSQFEFVADSSVAPINPIISQVSSVNSVNKKFLSGIEFWTKPIEFVYDVTLGNVFSNTFEQSADALRFKDVSTQSSSLTNNVTVTPTFNSSNNISVGLPSGQIFNVVDIGSQFFTQSIVPPTGVVPSSQLSFSITYSVADHVRRINDSIGFAVDVKRTVQGTFSGATSLGVSVPVTSWFIDTLDNESNTQNEYFTDEVYRKKNGATKFNTYTSLASAIAATWSSSSSLISSADQNNGLQVINGILVYPKFNFDSAGTPVTNPNFGFGISRNYSNANTISTGFGINQAAPLTNNRTYTRLFQFPRTQSTRTIDVYASGTSYINSNVAISGNQNVWIEVKWPGQTGWLDATRVFVSRSITDGNGGSVNVTPMSPPGAIRFMVTSGTLTSTYLMVRITAGPDWTGYISRITVS